MLEKRKEEITKKTYKEKVEILEYYLNKVQNKKLIKYYMFGAALNATKEEYKHLKKKLRKEIEQLWKETLGGRSESSGKKEFFTKLYNKKSKQLIGDEKILWTAHNCSGSCNTYASQSFYHVVKSFPDDNMRNKILNTNIAWRSMIILVGKSKHDNWPGAGKKRDQGGSHLHKAIYDLQQSSD